MRRNVNQLAGFSVLATDGKLGHVEEFYFDDEAWGLRYVIVNVGNWHLRRNVLISPVSLEQPDWAARIFPVKLTRDQIRNSPDIDTDKPVYRQHEERLHAHYAWPVYWPQNQCVGEGYGFMPAVPVLNANSAIPKDEGNSYSDESSKRDPHLRSTRRVTGYTVQANDGEIGHVNDFILNDETWKISYLVIDIEKWLPGRKILVAPKWIERVSWSASKVFLYAPMEFVRNSPVYDPSGSVSDEYDNKLRDYYGKTWLSEKAS